MAKCMIGPSILNSDLSQLGCECQRMVEYGADYLHLDVMDGHFVPNITFGHPVVACIRPKVPSAFLDVHMMVAEPEKWIVPMAEAGADQFTFHLESVQDPVDCIRQIRASGMKVGLAIKPQTPVERVLAYVESVDLILIMTVEPGFGGQKFMHDMMPKVKQLRAQYKDLDIEVDGGVGPDTIHHCAEAGANVIVSGSAVMKSNTPRDVIALLRKVVQDSIESRAAAVQPA